MTEPAPQYHVTPPPRKRLPRKHHGHKNRATMTPMPPRVMEFLRVCAKIAARMNTIK